MQLETSPGVRALSTFMRAGALIAAIGGALVLGNLTRSLFNLWPITDQPQRYLGPDGAFYVSLGWYLTGAGMILVGCAISITSGVSKAFAAQKPDGAISSAAASVRQMALVVVSLLCILPAIPMTMEVNARREAEQSKTLAEEQARRGAELTAKAQAEFQHRIDAANLHPLPSSQDREAQREHEDLTAAQTAFANLTSTDAGNRYRGAQELIRHQSLVNALTGSPFATLRDQIVGALDKDSATICTSAQINGMVEILYDQLNPSGSGIFRNRIEAARHAEIQHANNLTDGGFRAAIAQEDVGAVAEFLKSIPKADLNNNQTVAQGMNLAILGGHEGVISTLIDNGVSPDTHVQPNGVTPLLMVCSGSQSATQMNIIKLLIAKGANPSAASQFTTCLLSAVEHKNTELVKLLLDAKADPNIKGMNDSSPLSEAFSHRDPAMITLLLQHGANPNTEFQNHGNSLLSAIQLGNAELVNLLLEKGANPNQAGQNGETALSDAVSRRHPEMVTSLLKHGADANQHTRWSDSLVATVVDEGDADMLKAFVDAKAKLDGRDTSGRTLAQIAAEADNEKVLKVLIDGGAPLNTSDEFGNTPLLAAIERRQDTVAGMLIDGKADVNKQDRFGRSALAQAVSLDDVPLTEKLLNAKADPNLTDSAGMTILDRMDQFGNPDAKLMKVLKEHGAKYGQSHVAPQRQLPPGSGM